MSIFDRSDERFVVHRLHATRYAAVAGAAVALGLFLWHVWFDRIWSWELLSVGLAMVAVKLAMMAWYQFTN